MNDAPAHHRCTPGVALLPLFLLAAAGAAGASGLAADSNVGGLDLLKALAAGLIAATVLCALVAAASGMGVALIPKPLCVAFLETALHRPIGLAAGLACNAAWIALWSFFYVFLFPTTQPLIAAAAFALVLWLLSMVFFFPAVGWGYFGRKLGPLASIDAALSYAAFAAAVWAINDALL